MLSKGNMGQNSDHTRETFKGMMDHKLNNMIFRHRRRKDVFMNAWLVSSSLVFARAPQVCGRSKDLHAAGDKI